MAQRDFRDEYIEGLEGLGEGATVHRRDGGCAVIVEHRMFVWGGQTEIEDEGLALPADIPFKSDPSFDVFNLKRRTWSRVLTTVAWGRCPINGLGSAMVYHPKREMIYLFGGWKMITDQNFFGDIYSISPSSLQWELIKPDNKIKPTPRYNAEMVLHRDRLCIFAGTGERPPVGGVKYDKGAKPWIASPNSADRSYGRNNDYFEFDLNDKRWSAPMITEYRPPLIAGHRMVKIDSCRVLMFGGRGEEGLSDDLWLLDLDNRTWTKVDKSGSWPRPARFFSLTPLVDPDLVGQSHLGLGPVLSQKLVLTGGKAVVEPNPQEVCNPETWLLEIEMDSSKVKWTELEVDLTPRSWHVAVPYHPHHFSTECEVLVSTGNKHVRPGNPERNCVSDTCVLTFGVRSLKRMCIAALSAFPELTSLLPTKLCAEADSLIASWNRDIIKATVCEKKKEKKHSKQGFQSDSAPGSEMERTEH